MFVVIFEVYPKHEGKAEYLELASGLRRFLAEQKGCISAERFQSLIDENKMLSLSYWESEEDINAWRDLAGHKEAQKAGRMGLFSSYTIRVAEVVREHSSENTV